MSPRLPWPARAVALLACPVCGQLLAALPGDAGLRCPAGHSFDRARQGHVTLLPPGHTPPSGDTAAMVADRAEVLSTGTYAGLTRVLVDAVAAGEGPVEAVLDRLPRAVGVVLDSSRYAARRAAGASPRALAVVADTWARLPVRDAAVDRVTVVFAPRNGPETARVLRPGGRLVVATPAPDHLAELVGPLGLLRVDPDKAARLSAALEPHLAPAGGVRHREELVLDRRAVTTVVGMGPHARHLTPEQLAAAVARLPAQVRVTLAVDVTTWTV